MVGGGINIYLADLDEPKRSTLEQLGRDVLAVVPDAQECISYGVPGFKVRGKTVAGFAAFKNHLSYLPHSGSVLAALADELAGYEGTKSSLHFAVDQPLPSGLVRKLIVARMRELGMSEPRRFLRRRRCPPCEHRLERHTANALTCRPGGSGRSRLATTPLRSDGDRNRA